MRLAPFALLAVFALPACAPYGYGYGGTYGAPAYGAPAYGAPAPGYGSPYYPPPAYGAPPAEGVLLFDGGRDDRRRYDRSADDDRRRYDRPADNYRPQGRPDDRQRAQQQARPENVRNAPPQQQPAPQGQVRQGGDRGHDPSYNPANPNAQGGGDR